MKNLAEQLEGLAPRNGTHGKPAVHSVRLLRSVRSMIPSIIYFVAMVTAVALVDWALIEFRLIKSTGRQMFLIRLLSAVPALFLLNLIRIYFNELYVFKARVCYHHCGRLSLNYLMPVIHYCDIREIIVKQSILGRMLNYGDVLLGTAATRGTELHLKGIYNPFVIQRFLEHMRRLRGGDKNPHSPESEGKMAAASNAGV